MNDQEGVHRMPARPTRLAGAIALAASLALPTMALAASPTAPPASVTAWQAHLDHMRAMGLTLGAHVKECVAMHGSMAGMMGPNGMMVEGMSGMLDWADVMAGAGMMGEDIEP
jgi:hypothetical protein